MDPVTTDLLEHAARGLPFADLLALLDELADEDNDRSVIGRIKEVEAIQEDLAAVVARAADVRELLEERRPVAPVLDFNEPLTGGRVRQAAERFAGGFTINELAAELEREVKEVRPFVKAMELDGRFCDTGQRISRTVIYEYKPSAPVPGADPNEHPHRTPPERERPAFTEVTPNRGEPVRVAAQQKITRRGRSTPGVGHKAKLRDLAWEREQAAKQARAEAQKSKAQKDPKWKRKK